MRVIAKQPLSFLLGKPKKLWRTHSVRHSFLGLPNKKESGCLATTLLFYTMTQSVTYSFIF